MTEATPPANGGSTDDDTTGSALAAELRRESASYRTQRNAALREAHAYKTMLLAHNIAVDGVNEDKLKDLPISDGRVDGKFDYTPPAIAVPAKPTSQANASIGGNAKPLTLDEVGGWSEEQINANWDEVQRLLIANTA